MKKEKTIHKKDYSLDFEDANNPFLNEAKRGIKEYNSVLSSKSIQSSMDKNSIASSFFSVHEETEFIVSTVLDNTRVANERYVTIIKKMGLGIPPDFWVASSSAADAAQTHIAFVQMGVGNPIDEWGKGISDYLPYDLMEKFSSLKKSPDNFTSKYCDTLLNELSLLNMTRRRGLFGGLLSKIF